MNIVNLFRRKKIEESSKDLLNYKVDTKNGYVKVISPKKAKQGMRETIGKYDSPILERCIEIYDKLVQKNDITALKHLAYPVRAGDGLEYHLIGRYLKDPSIEFIFVTRVEGYSGLERTLGFILNKKEEELLVNPEALKKCIETNKEKIAVTKIPFYGQDAGALISPTYDGTRVTLKDEKLKIITDEIKRLI